MKLLTLPFALILAAPALAQNGDPLATIKAALKDASQPFSLIVEFKLKPHSTAVVQPLVEAGVKATRGEAGNVAYSCYQDSQNPDTLVFLETWANFSALASHVTTPYTQALVGKCTELAAEPMKARVLTPLVLGTKRKVLLPDKARSDSTPEPGPSTPTPAPPAKPSSARPGPRPAK